MKVAIATQENNAQTLINEHFGRSPFFYIYDTETKQEQWISNTDNKEAAKGAGTKTASIIANTGATKVLLGGHVGPKAMDILNKMNITTQENLGNITLEEAKSKL